MKGGGFGVLGDIVAGVLGALLGGFLFRTFGMSGGGGFLLRTHAALFENDCESMTITVPRVGAGVVGWLIALLERAVGL
jgi:uncharacterized membrane protein YeaQ/YmgE (transglycosylase-associated protein family)